MFEVHPDVLAINEFSEGYVDSLLRAPFLYIVYWNGSTIVVYFRLNLETVEAFTMKVVILIA